MVALFASILSLAVGPWAPTVQGLDGHFHQPLSEAAGKPLAILFIAHDCPICNAYAPEIERLIHKYANRVRFDLVYSEERLSVQDAKAHAHDFSLTGATLLLDHSSTLAAYCGANVTPEAVVFDAKGKQAYKGRIDDRYMSLGQQRPAPTTRDLGNAIDAVLASKRPVQPKTPPVGCIIVFSKNS